ncbi:hypothetical protein [Deinococcus ficus]|uniref:hypothetical protein n=1 Tax=Deinococcus ficus TaxID=317577 RepID=UPI0017488526|nr:hypothetical protein [Deinococcus ficus]GHF67719.1 hypothetical protein GCM10017782_01610 [Deinococcus ficus]
MRALGYINVLWFQELMGRAVRASDAWFWETRREDADGEFDHYLLVGNFRNTEHFLNHGLLPAFQGLNAFQQSLVLDALALAIAVNEPDLWEQFNRRETLLGGDFEITDDPKQLFTSVFDILSSGKDIALSGYSFADPWVADPGDTLDLYRHIRSQGDQP